MLNRRHLLTLFAGVGAASLAACAAGTDPPAPSTTGGSTTTGAAPSATASLESDNVFRDGWQRQLATVTGSVAAGYVASLRVPV